MSWTQLQPLEAQLLYGVPSELAVNPKNLFWGVPFTLPYEYDSPRPFLAFLPSDKNSNIFTFHLQTIEPEAWGFKGMLPNPLIMEGGILGLYKPLLKGLVEILLSYQARIPVQINRPTRMFDLIKRPQLKQFRINPELFPNTRQEHFFQIYDPSSNEEQSITILILSNTPAQGK